MDLDKLSGWGISKQIAEVIERGFSFDDETGEVFFTSDDLEKLQIALDNKIESLAGFYQMYTSDASALKERAKQVNEKAKIFEKKAENIKKYIDELMKLNNKDKLQAGDKTISYRKSVSGNIIDENILRDFINSKDELKEKYFKYEEPDISKKALMDDIKASKQEDGSYNLEIPGFEIVENNNLQIK